MKRNLRPFDGIHPQLPESCFVDDTALIIGDAAVGEDGSVWPMAVIRADLNSVRVGARSNVQDFCMLHESHKNDKDPNGAPLTIGEDVTIGHHVNLHGCTIGDRVLVGMGTIVLDKAVVESDVIIGAGSLVPPGKRLASGYLYVGSPVKQARELTAEEREFLRYSAAHYVRLANKHKAGQ